MSKSEILRKGCYMTEIFDCIPQASLDRDIDVTALTVSEICSGYLAGKYNAESIVKAYISRIKKYDANYNAFISLNPSAIEDAQAIDKQRSAGSLQGPLSGIPIVIKDSIDVAGLPTTAGWAPLSKRAGGIDLIPEFDAPVVDRLRKAGVIILGKGNIPAFSSESTRANSSWAGPTLNAVDRLYAPGASSSGVATAVSANFVTVGLAEETMGSIQNPASAQALVGIKPTFGLVPTTGTVPVGGSTLDVVGPLAKNVRDASIMLDAIAGYTRLDPKTEASIDNIPNEGYADNLSPTALQRKRIGLYGVGWANQSLSSETKHLYDKEISTIKALGAMPISDPFADTDFFELRPPTGFRVSAQASAASTI